MGIYIFIPFLSVRPINFGPRVGLVLGPRVGPTDKNPFQLS